LTPSACREPPATRWRGRLGDDVAFANITNKPFAIDVWVPQSSSTSPVCH